MRWLLRIPPDRALSRHALPELVASYWTGASPQTFAIENISGSGMFLLTEERWSPGTVILMNLQRTDMLGKEKGAAIAVMARVVRATPQGMGMAFMFSGYLDLARGKANPHLGADRETLEYFLLKLNLIRQER